jgi:NADH:ubiquinone oxidoreductase subunit K
VKAAINIVAASSTFTAPEARGDVYQVVISELAVSELAVIQALFANR